MKALRFILDVLLSAVLLPFYLVITLLVMAGDSLDGKGEE